MTPADHANTVREALPSMDGHEDNCPCSVGRAHAALDALEAQAEETKRRLAKGWDEVVAADKARAIQAELRAEAAEARVTELEQQLGAHKLMVKDERRWRAEAEEQLKSAKRVIDEYSNALADRGLL